MLGTDDHYDSYNAWAVGDDYLDWTNGAESGQVNSNINCHLHQIIFIHRIKIDIIISELICKNQ